MHLIMNKMKKNIFLLAALLPGILPQSMAQQVVTATAPNASGTQVRVASEARVINGENLRATKNYKDEDLKSKEVSKEVSVPKGGEIYIENASRNIIIKTWDQPKVKVTTTVYYDGESKLTDEEWLEKLNLSLKTLGSSVKVKSGSIGGSSFYSSGSGAFTYYGPGGSGNGVAVFNGTGQNVGTKANTKRIVTVTIPAGSKLDLESKYADVSVPAGILDASIDIANGNLEAENLGKLVLRSRYSNVTVGDVKNAEIEFTNGRFSAKTINDLDIESKYSTIEMAAADKVVMRSTNDEYELEEAGDIRGRKSYGNLRITKLNNSIDIEGSNADIKIRKTGSALNQIKIDDKYADIRIPLRDVKNYSVDFTGGYSSVYGNFEKKVPLTIPDKTENKTTKEPLTAEEKGVLKATTVTGIVTGSGPRMLTGWRDDNSPNMFTATVGDGKGLKIVMKCQNCTVDFK
jgi:hypothetical protein